MEKIGPIRSYFFGQKKELLIIFQHTNDNSVNILYGEFLWQFI